MPGTAHSGDWLAEALRRFERKERNALIQNILSDGSCLPPLSRIFCEKISTKINTSLSPENCWWALDYHISWLAGALAVAALGETAALSQKSWINNAGLIKGNQEDIDLVVVSGFNLILIEVKGYGDWKEPQILSKFSRLTQLRSFYEGLVHDRESVRFHLLMASDSRPPQWIEKYWPNWDGKRAAESWIRIALDPAKLTTQRCNDEGREDKDGGHWHLQKFRWKAGSIAP
jgi:hypothetical protein